MIRLYYICFMLFCVYTYGVGNILSRNVCETYSIISYDKYKLLM